MCCTTSTRRLPLPFLDINSNNKSFVRDIVSRQCVTRKRFFFLILFRIFYLSLATRQILIFQTQEPSSIRSVFRMTTLTKLLNGSFKEVNILKTICKNKPKSSVHSRWQVNIYYPWR